MHLGYKGSSKDLAPESTTKDILNAIFDGLSVRLSTPLVGFDDLVYQGLRQQVLSFLAGELPYG